MQHERQSGVGEAAKDFLALAKRIAEEYRCFIVVERFAAKPQDSLKDVFGCGKDILWPAVSRFHDQNIWAAPFAWFRRKAPTQFEITRVKERFPFKFNQRHRTAENMAGRQQRDLKRLRAISE